MFIREFIKNPIKTGAITRSSRFLSEKITDMADLPNRQVIVEFGSGTGAFTSEILRKKNQDALFFSIEQNETFAQLTRNAVANATVYHDSAENVQGYLHEHGYSHCDCIISGLPWASFSRAFQQHLLDVTYDSLQDGGDFLTFAYHHGSLLPTALSFRRLLNERFKVVQRSEVIWRNVPPAFIYHCRK